MFTVEEKKEERMLVAVTVNLMHNMEEFKEFKKEQGISYIDPHWDKIPESQNHAANPETEEGQPENELTQSAEYHE